MVIGNIESDILLIVLNRIKIEDGFLGAFIVFCLISFLSPHVGSSDSVQTLFSVSSFLFGIFAAFSITNRHDRLNKIKEILRENDAIFLFFYQSSSIFGANKQKDIQTLIDKNLTDQIDYYLTDFEYSNASFISLFTYIVSLKPKNKTQETVYGKMVDLLGDMSKNRKQVETLVQSRMPEFEWLSLVILGLIIIFCIFYTNDGQLFMATASTLLATTVIVLLLIIRDLDTLRWKENNWIWTQLNDLFHEIGLLPYYPKNLIQSGRIKLDKNQTIRLASSPNKYPDMTGKVVEKIQI